MTMLKKSVLGPALFLATALAPAAAQEESFQMSRDARVGVEIAAQGNLALKAIRAELLQSVRALRPTLPAQSMPASLPAGGIAMVATTGPRCAK